MTNLPFLFWVTLALVIVVLGTLVYRDVRDGYYADAAFVLLLNAFMAWLGYKMSGR